jgi:predicted O-methyltransferase YrrM
MLVRRDMREVEAVQKRFRAIAAKRQFTHDWFDNNIPIWTEKLAAFKAQHSNPNILEIGSFEGRSTLFLLTHLSGSHITVMDIWAGGDEHQTGAALSPVEMRFDSNVAEFRDRITKIRGKSAEYLGALLSAGPSQFDLIYIDGSHYADDVMIDATLSWLLLRPQGMMIFDDYVFTRQDHGFRKSPCRAINLFLRLIKGEYELKHVGWQVIVVKTRAP